MHLTHFQEHLVTAVEFLKNCKNNNEVAYVHCKAGRTRSPTVVACYLMTVGIQCRCAVILPSTKTVWFFSKR